MQPSAIKHDLQPALCDLRYAEYTSRTEIRDTGCRKFLYQHRRSATFGLYFENVSVAGCGFKVENSRDFFGCVYTGPLDYLAGRIFSRVAVPCRYLISMASRLREADHLLWACALLLLLAIWRQFLWGPYFIGLLFKAFLVDSGTAQIFVRLERLHEAAHKFDRLSSQECHFPR